MPRRRYEPGVARCVDTFDVSRGKTKLDELRLGTWGVCGGTAARNHRADIGFAGRRVGVALGGFGGWVFGELSRF